MQNCIHVALNRNCLVEPVFAGNHTWMCVRGKTIEADSDISIIVVDDKKVQLPIRAYVTLSDRLPHRMQP